DFDTPNNADDPVSAAADGIAYIHLDAGSKSFGNHINIDHGNGYFTLYAHLKSFLVLNGQCVKQGQIIGIEDNTGFSKGDHLHFGLHRGDPKKDALESVSIAADRIVAKDDSLPASSFEEMRSDDFIVGLISGHSYSSNNTVSRQDCSTILTW